MSAAGWRRSAGPERMPALGRGTSLGLFATILIVIALGTGALVQLLTPGPETPPCQPGRPCAGPPVPPGHLPVGGPDTAPALATGQTWRSNLGFSLEYEPGDWAVGGEDATGVQLELDGGDSGASLWVAGVRAADASPEAALATRVDQLGTAIVGLAEDTDPAARILGANIGYVQGIGRTYGGALGSAQGPGAPARVAIMAATDGQATLTASLVLVGGSVDDWLRARSLADTVLNTVTWPTTGSSVGIPAAAGGRPTDLPGLSGRPRGVGAPGSVAAVDLGPADPTATIAFTLGLAPRDPVGLARYARDVGDPSSPDFGRTLSPAVIGERFGPSGETLDRLEATLTADGIAVVGRTPLRTTLRVQGPVRAVEAVFATHLERFRDAFGRIYVAPTIPPGLGPPLAPTVDVILGLDGRHRAIPASGRRPPAIAPTRLDSAVPASGLRPADVAAAYDLQPLRDLGLDGTGQTVAVVSFDSVEDATIAAFDQATNTSGTPVRHIPVNGGTEPGDDTSEVALDIEVIRAIAPKAQILDFEAPNDGTSFGEVVDAIVADGRAGLISISWGTCDDRASITDPERRADERSLQAAVAAGITVFVATGDYGAYDCRADRPDDLDPVTDWPGGSQYVVAVGGTRLELRTSSGYLAEQGWEDALEGSGSGGGIAGREPQPDWQAGPGVAQPASDGHRQVPDVAAAADPDSGFFTIWRDADQGLVQGSVGGTSAATPFWAGSAILIRQAAIAEGKRPPGFLAPLLYRVAAAATSGSGAFHDVVRGGNLASDAGPGWDFATGLGSPDVARLANELIDLLP